MSSKKTSSVQKVTFTRDSNERSGVTVTLGRLREAGFRLNGVSKGQLYNLIIKDAKGKRHEVPGYINRYNDSNKTIYLYQWPKGLGKPSVGRARKFQVVGIA